MSISAIMACDINGGISRNGSLPWPKNKEDFLWFKINTIHSTVVMGSKTWHDPIFPKPLSDRKNIVVSNKPETIIGADKIINGDILSQIKEMATDRHVWIIGGANLIEQCLSIIDRFYLTVFNNDYDCDTFIPLKKLMKWDIVKITDIGDFKIYILEKP